MYQQVTMAIPLGATLWKDVKFINICFFFYISFAFRSFAAVPLFLCLILLSFKFSVPVLKFRFIVLFHVHSI